MAIKNFFKVSFVVKAVEDHKIYMNRLKKEDKKNEELEPIAPLGNWSKNTYKYRSK